MTFSNANHSSPDARANQQARLANNWRAITAELDAPRPSIVQRVLGLVGIQSGTARLVAGTPALRRAWFGALAVAIIVGLAQANSADPRSSALTFLILAPLIPILGVGLAYGRRADPAHEITLSTPLSGLRLVLIRSAVVLSITAVLLCMAALTGPSVALMATAWLIPAVALVGLNLALMTVAAPHHASLITAAVWLTTIIVVQASVNDPLAAFSAPAQIAGAAITAGGLVVATRRREAFDHLETGA